MKPLNKSITLPVFLVASIALQGQTIFKKPVEGNLKIGKSSDNSYTKSKAAEGIITFPGNDSIKQSWLTNGFIEIGINGKDDPNIIENEWSLGGVFEIHKNTLIEKEQDVRQYGLSFGFNLAGVDSGGRLKSETLFSLSLKNADNLIKKEKTLQIVGGVTYNRMIGSSWLKTQTTFPRLSGVGKYIGFSHNHNLGFAYLGRDENIMLGQFDFEFNAYLFRALSNTWINQEDLFKLQVSYNARTPIFGTTTLDLDNTLNLQAGINFSFDSDKKNTIELAFNKIQGANPLEGLEKQNYSTITVKVKIGL